MDRPGEALHARAKCASPTPPRKDIPDERQFPADVERFVSAARGSGRLEKLVGHADARFAFDPSPRARMNVAFLDDTRQIICTQTMIQRHRHRAWFVSTIAKSAITPQDFRARDLGRTCTSRHE
jgi:hypothetical protein